MKAAVNVMRKQEPVGGTIIQIGSNASYMGFCPGAGTAYTVSKHGVAALVKSTAAFYGESGVYSVGLMLGAMLDTNLVETSGGMSEFNLELFMKLGPAAGVKPEEAVQLKDVGKYCVFLADRSVAATANGSCINFNRNWPKA
jgi:NAD(P)-dependent dehydrogenase (short-subunit alcohol dehydrogenase family)